MFRKNTIDLVFCIEREKKKLKITRNETVSNQKFRRQVLLFRRITRHTR